MIVKGLERWQLCREHLRRDEPRESENLFKTELSRWVRGGWEKKQFFLILEQLRLHPRSKSSHLGVKSACEAAFSCRGL